jgi:hypothetical protein
MQINSYLEFKTYDGSIPVSDSYNWCISFRVHISKYNTSQISAILNMAQTSGMFFLQSLHFYIWVAIHCGF